MENKLLDYVEKNGLTKTAAQLGLKPPSLYLALSSGRDIRVVAKGSSVSAYEVRPFPSPAAKKRWEGA